MNVRHDNVMQETQPVGREGTLKHPQLKQLLIILVFVEPGWLSRLKRFRIVWVTQKQSIGVYRAFTPMM